MGLWTKGLSIAKEWGGKALNVAKSPLGLGTGAFAVFAGQNVIEQEQAKSASQIDKQNEVQAQKSKSAIDVMQANENALLAVDQSNMFWDTAFGKVILSVLDSLDLGDKWNGLIDKFVDSARSDAAQAKENIQERQDNYQDKIDTVNDKFDPSSTIGDSIDGFGGSDNKLDQTNVINNAYNQSATGVETDQRNENEIGNGPARTFGAPQPA